MEEKRDIYELCSNSSNAVYVGRTYRNFKIRLKEHITCLRSTSTEFSQFPNHIKESGYSFDKNSNYEILHILKVFFFQNYENSRNTYL